MRKLLFAVLAVAAIFVIANISYSAYVAQLPYMPPASKVGWRWYSAVVPALDSASQATRTVPVFTAPCNGVIRGVQVTTGANVTGQNTNTRTLKAKVFSTAGVESLIDSISFWSGTNASKGVPLAVYNPAITATPQSVSRGEVVAITDSLRGTGLALPNFLVEVLFEGKY